MQKIILLIVIAIAVMACGRRSADDYVWTGQLYNAGRHAYPEKIKGKVKEITHNNYQAGEENGKVVRGNAIASSKEQYNSSGTMVKYEVFDTLGKITSYVTVEAEGKIINKAMYYTQDTLRGYARNTYTGSNLTEVKAFDPENDTLFMSVVYTYDQNGARSKYQVFNYRNEPQQYVVYSFGPNGLLKTLKAYSATGELTQDSEWFFNDQGERISSHEQNLVTGNLTEYKYKNEYDEKGNIIKWTFYIDEKPIQIRERIIKYYD